MTAGPGSSIKGLILAGGSGTRLHPLTIGVSKQLLPVYDKPLVYYPLSVLMLAQIREILIITRPEDRSSFERLLGDGSRLGLSLSYAQQTAPRGIADAFLVASDFIGTSRVALALGDNIFYGNSLQRIVAEAVARPGKATVFAYQVRDPDRYGVVFFDESGHPRSIVERPSGSTSPWAVTGLYFYDNDVVQMARSLRPSARGELEISDINARYLALDRLHVARLGRGIAWLDTGTHESLHQAGSFIQTLEARQGLKVGCIEEIAYRMGHIGRSELLAIAAQAGSSDYGAYLRRVAEDPTTASSAEAPSDW